jgi:hypothetical protein
MRTTKHIEAFTAGDMKMYASIERTKHYNGSGSSAFGGMKEWPVVRLIVPFHANATKQRNAFAKKLRAFVIAELNKSNEPKP